MPWPKHPSARTDGIVNGSPILTFNGFRFGPPGSVPQEIQQGNWSFRDDFTVSLNAAGRHDLKIGADYIKNSFWLLICRDCTGIYRWTSGPIPANFAANFPVWNDPETWNLERVPPDHPALHPGHRRFHLRRRPAPVRRAGSRTTGRSRRT